MLVYISACTAIAVRIASSNSRSCRELCLSTWRSAMLVNMNLALLLPLSFLKDFISYFGGDCIILHSFVHTEVSLLT